MLPALVRNGLQFPLTTSSIPARVQSPGSRLFSGVTSRGNCRTRFDSVNSQHCRLGDHGRKSLGLGCRRFGMRVAFAAGEEGNEGMLKISIVESPSQCRLVLEGKLIQPWASELRNQCSKAKGELQGR